MPTMYEIYEKHSVEYDDLVRFEDYQGNLKNTLHKINNFTGQSIIEFGSGTGRLTKTFIEEISNVRCFDRSAHMLQKAKENLQKYQSKISFQELNHLDADKISEKADVVIEGWAFGHTVYNDKDNYQKTIHTLIENCERLVQPGGKVIIVETMGGTLANEPEPPGELLIEFYNLLENEYGYSKTIISTDYKFDTINDAKLIMGFFFGEWIESEIEKHNSAVIPEFTGIWSKTIY
jgi:ubiquinone/menaquinone biosynthesis C-methylase UbiE